MPKIVDHDERRTHLIAIAADYIADHGLENTGLRDIANAAGFSQNIVSHYFESKDELLWKVQQYVSARAINRYLNARDKSLMNLVYLALPFAREQEVEWKVRINFWAMLSHHPKLLTDYQEVNSLTRASLQAIIRDEQQRGAADLKADVALLADKLLSLSTALSTHIILDSGYYTKSRCKRLIMESIGMYIILEQ